MLDGTVDGHTASMLQPYADRHTDTGLPMWKQEALDAFEHAARVNGTTERRHRLEHAELPSPEDLPRFRALGVIASTQAVFASPDAITLASFAPALGPERASRADAFRLFDEARGVQASGSDYPVFTMEVMRDIHAAVTRQLPDGTPADGWYPRNRIGIAAALRHHSVDAAYASREEHEKGALAPGRMADFVVLSENVFSMPPERLWAAKATVTVVGGQVRWDAVGHRALPLWT